MVDTCPHISTENISFSVQGKRVFKDQCMKCYDNPRSPNGLDVCLKCFSGYCKSEMFNHTNLHFSQFSHPIVMNIKEQKVIEEKKENEPVKITKLAIGKPGGADFTGEQWEQIIQVSCKKCNKVIDYEKNEQLKSLVTSVLNAASESEKSGIKAWEEEILPCEHTLTLQQFPGVKIVDSSLKKCSQCDLSSNLWLCLTCGNLSCGRKEAGGNAHAIEHYKQTKHPLVVKTGTITPNGEASLYCYDCDNDVKDPELPNHLIHFGIDINTQKKTDKTVTEMNLDFNLNFTLSKTIEDGKVLTPLYGPGYTGLENLGNSCYMNSVLQILLSLEPFKKWYLDGALEHLNTCYKNPIECYMCQMSKIMYGLHSGMYSVKKERELPATEEGKKGEIEEYQDGIKPSSFKLYFGRDHPDFSSNKQQDALEYMSYLLDIMKTEDRGRKIDPLKLFTFEIENRMECTKCHCVKYRKQKQVSLSLSCNNIKEKKEETSECTMEESISKFLGEEIVDGLECSECKAKTNWIKTQKVLNFPKYLIVIFQRFDVINWVPVKLEVQFKPQLDNFDLKILQRDHSKPNEKVLEVAADVLAMDEEREPEFKQDDLNYLLQCGIPELGAKWALYKNNNNPDIAMGWYCEHSEDPDIKQPLPKIKVQKGKSKSNVDPVALQNLIGMGFTEQKATIALKKNHNNVDNALNFLFDHPEDLVDDTMDIDEEEEEKELNKGNGSLYNIYGYITHLGKNADHGHYVCHIRKEGDTWTYFNDLRVNSWDNPPVHKGYIYVYKNTAPSA